MRYVPTIIWFIILLMELYWGVRHNVIIPWDDDIDVWMTRDNYERHCLILSSSENEKRRYKLQNNTELGEVPADFQGKYIETYYHCERNLFGTITTAHPWIDIFILDKYPTEKESRFFKSVKRQSIVFSFVRLRNNKNAEMASEGIHRLIFSANKIIPFLDWLAPNNNTSFKRTLTVFNGNRKSNKYFCFATEYMGSMKKCTFEIEWFDEPALSTFNGRLFYFPSNPGAVLERVYGDYLKLPPKNEQVNKQQISNIRKAGQ